MRLFDQVSVATEVIDFQRNTEEFKTNLVSVISAIKEKLASGVYINNNEVINSGIELNKLVKEIADYTGIKLVFPKFNWLESLTNANNASIYPLVSNYLNSLVSPDIKKEILAGYDLGTEEQAFEKIKHLKSSVSTIDLKNAKVSGELTKLDFLTYVDFKGLMLGLKITPAELAAIIMHEVGHAFTYLEFNNKFNIINQAFYNIANQAKVDDKNKLIKTTFGQFKDIDKDLTEKDVEKMFSDNKIIASFEVYKFIAKNTDFDNLVLSINERNAHYDSETMADVFATRMGFGAELSTGLSKLYKFGNKSEQIADAISHFRLFLILYFTLLSAGMLAAICSLVPTLVVKIILKIITIKFPEIYKDQKERPQKIYNQLVETFKRTELSSSQKKEILDSLTMIRQVIDMGSNKVSILDKLVLAIYKSPRLDRSHAFQQDVLERLASNELFVKSVELELLKKG